MGPGHIKKTGIERFAGGNRLASGITSRHAELMNRAVIITQFFMRGASYLNFKADFVRNFAGGLTHAIDNVLSGRQAEAFVDYRIPEFAAGFFHKGRITVSCHKKGKLYVLINECANFKGRKISSMPEMNKFYLSVGLENGRKVVRFYDVKDPKSVFDTYDPTDLKFIDEVRRMQLVGVSFELFGGRAAANMLGVKGEGLLKIIDEKLRRIDEGTRRRALPMIGSCLDVETFLKENRIDVGNARSSSDYVASAVEIPEIDVDPAEQKAFAENTRTMFKSLGCKPVDFAEIVQAFIWLKDIAMGGSQVLKNPDYPVPEWLGNQQGTADQLHGKVVEACGKLGRALHDRGWISIAERTSRENVEKAAEILRTMSTDDKLFHEPQIIKTFCLQHNVTLSQFLEASNRAGKAIPLSVFSNNQMA